MANVLLSAMPVKIVCAKTLTVHLIQRKINRRNILAVPDAHAEGSITESKGNTIVPEAAFLRSIWRRTC